MDEGKSGLDQFITEKSEKQHFISKKGGVKMATQLQPTPTLYGKDAEAVLKQLQKKPTPEQIRRAKERSEFFKQINKKGL